ncbi:MAG TPA: NADP-dependent phosphogluconate dehydrogenase [Chitinophagaceae bacterium]|jgi:6-phosphogluconate dehydrogenase|nr:NADP-dependent phosphogluconate dehydrogenase [Chitinophagaceae bacterium]
MSSTLYDFGMIGLGTMGCNLLLNMADNHFAVIGFDINRKKAEEFEASANLDTIVKGVFELSSMTQQLKKPRKLMMLVPAGKPVDDVITNLLPLLEKDDIIIDGGNSHFTDTLRRINFLQEKGIHFMGIGISGGEMGARTGPSIMPGGDETAWQQVKPILEAVSAKVNGEPCVAYMGKWAAGHYVKMVHNGIEYAIMQLISEAYDILKRGAGLENEELHEIFKKWNEGEMKSFLLEITADIFTRKDADTGKSMVDIILDKAGAKGTGKWTSQNAMDLSMPIPTIDAAVAARDISVYKDERIIAAELYSPVTGKSVTDKEKFILQLHDALYFATIICYAQGFALLHKASSELDMNIPLPDVIKIWRGGCIIRSALLDGFYAAYKKNPDLSNILLNKKIARLIKSKEKKLRTVIKQIIAMKIPVAGFASALSYFDAYCSSQLPTNLIQAQRDYFGAHMYQRIDKPGLFHNEWQPLPEHAKKEDPGAQTVVNRQL